jgi:hypothetical protein
MQKKESNILMVGGNARKSGKTSLICRLLEQFGRQYPIIAVKVAIYADKDIFLEHFPLARNKGYLEIKEEDRNNKKDSGKYLAAGALESWFLAATLKNILRVHEN